MALRKLGGLPRLRHAEHVVERGLDVAKAVLDACRAVDVLRQVRVSARARPMGSASPGQGPNSSAISFVTSM